MLNTHSDISNDTRLLLGRCDAGIQMAIGTIDDVLPAVQNEHMRRKITANRAAHRVLLGEADAFLHAMGEKSSEPNVMAKTMSRVKSDFRLAFKPGDASVADLIVSGCNMGIKNLHKYQNQYIDADGRSRDIADRLIGLEAELARELYPYL